MRKRKHILAWIIAICVISTNICPALANEKNQPFAVPDGLNFVRVNRATGVSAAEDPSGTIITEAFKPGQYPNPAKVKTAEQSDAVVGGIF